MTSALSAKGTTRPKERWGAWLVLGGIVLLALLLRLYRLDELPPGFHGDEAHNVLDALGVLEGGPRPIFFEANNGREPLFIYLIAAFIASLGESAVIFRTTAAVVGTATVGLTFMLVREMLVGWDGGRAVRVALLSSLLLAISQWHLNFSRMDYRAISLPLLEVITFYFLFRGLHRSSTISFALAGVGLGLTLYTYTAAVMVPLILVIFVLGQWLLRHGSLPRRYLGQLALMLVISLITFAPLGLYYLTHLGSAASHGIDVSVMGGRDPIDLSDNLLRVAGMFSFSGDENWRHNLAGRPVFDPLLSLAFLVGLGLAGGRLLDGIRRNGAAASDSKPSPAEAHLFVLLWLAVMLVPSLITTNAPHFLRGIGAVPAAMILPALALGTTWDGIAARLSPNRLGRWLAAGMVAAIVSFAALSTYRAYFEDWATRPQTFYEYDTPSRELSSYVKLQAGDYRIYLHKRLARHATTVLFLRGTPYVPFDSDVVLPFPKGAALYLLPAPGPYADFFASYLPPSVEAEELRDSLGEPMALAFRLPSGSDALTSQAGPGMAQLLRKERPIVAATPGGELTIAGQIALMGYALSSDDGNALRESSAVPGEDLEAVLHFRALRPVSDDYTISLRLVDAEGRLWAQKDSFPGAGTYPTRLWSQGENVFDRRRLSLPADLPPGSYRLQLAAYVLETGVALPLENGDGGSLGTETTLGPVTVAAPSPQARDAFVIQHPSQVAVSPQLTLLGHSLDPENLRPGESLDLRVFWEVTATPQETLHLRLEVSDAQGALVAQQREALLHDQYPTERWRPGDAFQDIHRLRIGPRAAAGPSQIRIELLGISNTILGEVVLEGPTIEELPRLFEKPSPEWRLGADFGGVATLLGFDADAEGMETRDSTPWIVAEPGGELQLRLYWQALQQTDQSFSVFVQLLDDQGQLVSQYDGIPARGRRPITGWISDEIIADDVSLPVPSPGDGREYTIIVGLYDPATGERLRTPSGGDHVVLGRLVVR